MGNLKVNKSVRLELVKPESAYYKRNAHAIGKTGYKLGNTVNATLAITQKDKFLKVVLPYIIGTSETSPDWANKVTMYFNNFTKTIPASGLDLEIGLEYSSEKNQVIAEKELTDLKSQLDTDLANLKGLTESEKAQREHLLYKNYNIHLFDYYTGAIQYGTPLNKEHYLIYCYCLVNSQVANREDDVKKSKNIRFYFLDKEARANKISKLFKLSTEAEKTFFEIMNDKTKVDSILYMFKENVFTMGDLETKQMKLKSYVQSRPAEFLSFAKDKQLEAKSFIEECINNSLLKRLPNSTLIADNDNNIIGQDIDEALLYFADIKNTAFKNKLANQLKSLN